jgi:hypothetical protein
MKKIVIIGLSLILGLGFMAAAVMAQGPDIAPPRAAPFCQFNPKEPAK